VRLWPGLRPVPRWGNSERLAGFGGAHRGGDGRKETNIGTLDIFQQLFFSQVSQIF